MRGRVVAVPPEEYERVRRDALPRLADTASNAGLPALGRAVEARGQAPDSLAALGERVAAERGCLRCHTLDGTPHIGPSWAGLYGARIPLQDGSEIVADDAYLTESMMDPLARVRRGFEAVMPTYQGLLNAAETGALVALIHRLEGRGLWLPNRAPLPNQVAEPIRLRTAGAPGGAGETPPSARVHGSAVRGAAREQSADAGPQSPPHGGEVPTTEDDRP
jgi:cytochrome c oxidase subunit 2